MKKGYIFSWYNSGRNYGQTLQAFALQKVVSDIGYSVEHVCFGTNRGISQNFIGKLKDFKNLTSEQRKIQRKFDLFIQDNMKVTRRLDTDDEVKEFIQENNPDFLICGSDQVWNPYNVHPFYYLAQIGNKDTNRIAYAVSTCDERRKSKFLEYPEVESWIKQIDKLYVRENSGKKILSDLFNVDSDVVLDPTLLLSSEEWIDTLHLKKKQSNYILCYAFNLSDFQKKILREREEKLGCSIKYGNVLLGEPENKEPWSPYDFLEAILNAQEVYTDSFHGMVFSILFHKDFIVFDNGNDITSDPYYNIDRMNTLLKFIGLEGRLVLDERCYSLEKIDYFKVDKLLSERRSECRSLLKRSIG